MASSNVPHWLVYVSGHGFGHWSQVAPVLNHAREVLPDLQLTLCTQVPYLHLQSRLVGGFTHIPVATDFGMIMASALDVLPVESMTAYQRFHANWERDLAVEIERMQALKPDLVLSNVAYLPLLAAKQAGMPAIAMCSLNWADIFRHYCGGFEGARAIHAGIQAAYQEAGAFLRLEPGMPMRDFTHRKEIGPVARIGHNRREELARKLALQSHEKVVLVSMGGIATRLPMESWPCMSGIRWLVEDAWKVCRPDTVALESLDMNFIDLLASSDALLCKPGYGSFTEAACNGVPVIYVSRQDWPEEPCLVEWIKQNGLGLEVTRQQLETGKMEEVLCQLLAQPKPLAVTPSGIRHAVDFMLEMAVA